LLFNFYDNSQLSYFLIKISSVYAIGFYSAPYSLPINGEYNGSGFASAFASSQVIAHEIPPSVAIEIKPPAQAPVRINLESRNATPVAIISTPNFDATQVDPATISLAGAGVRLRRNGTYSCTAEDVNRDGLPDLVCQVVTSQLQLGPTSPHPY
jgi:hypothetical protein